MTDKHALAQTVSDLISRRGEGVYWDFKCTHHAHKGDLVHDVLCLANAEHAGPRFLIFGVDPTDFSLHATKGSAGRKTQADIAGFFRDNAGKFFQSRFPTLHLREIEIGGTSLDVLVIEDEPKKPYYLIEKIEKVRAHHIYTRVCDTNTPVDRSAQPHEIERMWRERFGLDAPALERARRCLEEPAAWTLREEDGFACCHHNVFPEFTLRAANAEDHIGRSQEWTRGEIVTDGNHAGWYEVRCHQTLLRRVHYVSFDDNKKNMVAPDWVPVGKGRFYFYRAESVEAAVQQFWTEHTGRDDSKGLLIGGDGESSCEARARWRRGVDIPVVKPSELEGFLEGRRWDAISGPRPATDRGEQYELYLRNLLDFDDWRRAQSKGPRRRQESRERQPVMQRRVKPNGR